MLGQPSQLYRAILLRLEYKEGGVLHVCLQKENLKFFLVFKDVIKLFDTINLTDTNIAINNALLIFQHSWAPKLVSEERGGEVIQNFKMMIDNDIIGYYYCSK